MMERSEIVKVNIAFVAIFLGYLLVAQGKAIDDVKGLLVRDQVSSVFQEIMVLKNKNEDLEKEIDDLESNLEQLANRDLALGAISREIEKYRKLNGKSAVFGPGLEIVIEGEITQPWLVDIVNEIFSAGAEAVSVNDIRIVNFSAGFDTLPQGQILLNGSIITEPFKIKVMGEASTISEVLELPGGIYDRLEAAFPGVSIKSSSLEVVQML